MGNREKDVLSKVLTSLIPFAWSTLVRVVEEVVQKDINKDGDVGFGVQADEDGSK